MKYSSDFVVKIILLLKLQNIIIINLYKKMLHRLYVIPIYIAYHEDFRLVVPVAFIVRATVIRFLDFLVSLTFLVARV